VLEYQWRVHINVDAVNAAVFFSKPDSPLPTSDVQEWIIEWGTKYITSFKLSPATTIKDIQSNIQRQLTQHHNRTGPFSSRDAKLSRMSEKDTARDYWLLYVSDGIELVHIAIALLSICPSEASVERTFSQQDMIHRDQRNRLHQKSIRGEMMIKFNTPKKHRTVNRSIKSLTSTSSSTSTSTSTSASASTSPMMEEYYESDMELSSGDDDEEAELGWSDMTCE
jgi:hypothetical protein